MSTAPSPAFWAAAFVYTLAFGWFWLVLAKTNQRHRVALAMVSVAFVCHGVDIGWRGVQGVHPAQSVREALGFLAFIVTGGYLLVSWRYRLYLGAIVVIPISLLMLIAARLSPVGDALSSGLSVLGRVHISLATLGVAMFALAAVMSAVYLVEDRNLKRKRFDTLSYRAATPLERLDKLTHALVLGGFPVFTLAMALGTAWLVQLGRGWGRVEYWLAIVTWVVLAALLVTRTALGWRGRRGARLTLLGFGLALAVMLLYLARRMFGA